jgi:hypothetical protein
MSIKHLVPLFFILPFSRLNSQIYNANNIYDYLGYKDQLMLSDLVDKTCRALDNNKLPYFFTEPCSVNEIKYSSLYSEGNPNIFKDLIYVLPDPCWRKLRAFENDSNLSRTCPVKRNEDQDSQRVKYSIKHLIDKRIKIQNNQDSINYLFRFRDSIVGTNTKLHLNKLYRFVWYGSESNTPRGENFIILNDTGSFITYGHFYTNTLIVSNLTDQRYIVRGNVLIVERVSLVYSKIYRDYTCFSIKRKSLVMIEHNNKKQKSKDKNKKLVFKLL